MVWSYGDLDRNTPHVSYQQSQVDKSTSSTPRSSAYYRLASPSGTQASPRSVPTFAQKRTNRGSPGSTRCHPRLSTRRDWLSSHLVHLILRGSSSVSTRLASLDRRPPPLIRPTRSHTFSLSIDGWGAQTRRAFLPASPHRYIVALRARFLDLPPRNGPLTDIHREVLLLRPRPQRAVSPSLSLQYY